MEYFIARRPVFNRQREVFGYRLELCSALSERFCAMVGAPEDAEALYRRLCLAGFDGSPDSPAAILNNSDDSFERLLSLMPKNRVVVEFGRNRHGVMTDLKEIRRLKALGYRALYESADVLPPIFLQLADIIKLDYAALSAEQQRARVSAGKGRAMLCACGVGTWEDFTHALDIGYDFFQGDFYKKPLPGGENRLKPFNVSVIRVMSELSRPEPGFKELTAVIEHDLNLSYSLLRRVNSAYIAPKFKVKTISQAVTILGLHEINAFMTTTLMQQVRNTENSELLRLSLIRGKLMDLLAGARALPQKGSEAFFVGIFSLIDVILNRPMAAILDELPLTDAVKEALLGGENDLRVLLDMVRLYEQADWAEFEALYGLDTGEQERLTDCYLSALEWTESFDF